MKTICGPIEASIIGSVSETGQKIAELYLRMLLEGTDALAIQ